VVLTLADTDYVAITSTRGDKQAFSKKIQRRALAGIDPTCTWKPWAWRNQTTNVARQTEEVQRPIRQAVIDRDGPEVAAESSASSTTICGAYTRAARCVARIAECSYDLLLVVGVTTVFEQHHTRRDGEEKLPTYFVLNRFAACFRNGNQALQLARKTRSRFTLLVPNGPL